MEDNKPSENNPEKNTTTIFSGDEFSVQQYDKHIRQARNAIFAVAILLTLSVALMVATSPGSYEYLWFDLLLWGAFIVVFVVLGFWTKKKPFYAIVSALVLYGFFIALNAYLDPATIIKGILVKIIIIVFLVKGLRDAKEAQKMKDEFNVE
jgi:prepilin signal peptidase PulO-like enzyme (type II secretory pathway)